MAKENQSLPRSFLHLLQSVKTSNDPIARTEGESLRKAYVFTRTLIDRLRMVRGNVKDLVLPPPESEEFVFLARRVGYTTDDWQTGARHLQMDIEEHMGTTRKFF